MNKPWGTDGGELRPTADCVASGATAGSAGEKIFRAARSGSARAAKEIACGNRDGRAIFVDIPAHVFLDLPVLVLAFGCWIHRRFRADWLPSSGATRVTGDKPTVLPWLDPQL